MNGYISLVEQMYQMEQMNLLFPGFCDYFWKKFFHFVQIFPGFLDPYEVHGAYAFTTPFVTLRFKIHE